MVLMIIWLNFEHIILLSNYGRLLSYTYGQVQYIYNII